MKRSVLILIFVWTAISAFSSSIEPKPLRKLIIESEFIVTGKVLGVTLEKNKDDGFPDKGTVRIQINEVLQGDITSSVIEMRFYNNVCSQLDYGKGVTIVAFVDRVDNIYYLHAGKSSAKKMSAMEIVTYKARIREMQSILEIADNSNKFNETVDWLVQCAQHEETRLDAETELFRISDFMLSNFQTKEEALQFKVSSEQKIRLKNALLGYAQFSYNDLALVDLAYEGNEMEIKTFLLKQLKSIVNDKSGMRVWYVDDIMVRMLRIKHTPELEKLFSDYYDIETKPGNDKVRILMIEKFIATSES